MKEDQLPDCYVQANDNHYVCYVMEYDDEEHMDIDEKYLYADSATCIIQFR
jgi:hypothetical protein